MEGIDSVVPAGKRLIVWINDAVGLRITLMTSLYDPSGVLSLHWGKPSNVIIVHG